MREHAIYYFSGTGNSLWAALTIQKALGHCDLIPMEVPPHEITPQKSLGFVFPCHFGGVPARVLEFIDNLNVVIPSSCYIYAVVTYGALVGSTLGQLNQALLHRGIVLNYAASLKSFSNYVVAYDMSDKVAEKTAQSKLDLQDILTDILSQQALRIRKPSPVILAYNHIANKNLPVYDKKFIVQGSCNYCGLCKQVCPVQNIIMEDGEPRWTGKCRQCLACLQWCPKRAIDYGSKTQKRGRYTHPEITSKMFADYLGGAGIQS